MDNSENKKESNFTIGGNWEKQSTKLREKYSQLTESDLKCEAGKETDMLKRVESKLNKNREEVIKIINDFKVSPENGHAKNTPS